MNIWGIREFDGDGVSCPIVPRHLPWHKRAVLFFFRFGLCPACITMSLAYNVKRLFSGARARSV
jgi:hypothetical protein